VPTKGAEADDKLFGLKNDRAKANTARREFLKQQEYLGLLKMTAVLRGCPLW